MSKHQPSAATRRTALRVAGLCLVLAAAALPMACGGGGGAVTGPPAGSVPLSISPSLTGRWNGTGANGNVRVDVSFQQSGRSVEGSGTFTSPIASGPFTVAGMVDSLQVAFTMSSEQFGTANYRGQFVSENRITGAIEQGNSPLSGVAITLERR